MALQGILLTILLAPGLAPQTKDIDVLILAGQSNMVGAGRVSNTPDHLIEYVQENPAILQRSWINGEDWEDDWHNLIPRGSWIGPEMMLGHVLSDFMPDRQFAFMKIAYNGTNLACSWDPDGCGPNLFQVLCDKVDLWEEELEMMGFNVRHAGFIWVQGEGDCKVEWQANKYEENLRQLVDRVRFQTNNATLPCVIAKVNPIGANGATYDYKDIVHLAMDTVAAEDDRVATVTCKTTQLKEDLVHFTTEGMLELGAAMGDAYLALDPFETGIPIDCPSDVNNNGQVEVMDILQILGDLGPCP